MMGAIYLTIQNEKDYACVVAGIPAAEFGSSSVGVRKPTLSGVAFFVPQSITWATQLVGRVLRGFKPAVSLRSRSSNLASGSPFLFGSKNSETSERRSVAMCAQTHIMVAQAALQKHTKNLIACIDDIDAVKHRIELLLRDYEDDAPAYFTLLSIQKEIERVNGQLYAEAVVA